MYDLQDKKRAEEIELGTRLINEQSPMGAVAGAYLGSLMFVGLWFVIVLQTGTAGAGVLFCFCGPLVALMVRLMGKGLTIAYRVISIVFSILCIFLIAWITGAGFSFLFALGFLLSFSFAVTLPCRGLSWDEERAVFLAQSEGVEKPDGNALASIYAVAGVLLVLSFMVVFPYMFQQSSSQPSSSSGPQIRIEDAEVGTQAFVDNALRKGREIGQVYMEHECKGYVDYRESAICLDDHYCLAESEYILQGCEEAARMLAQQ